MMTKKFLSIPMEWLPGRHPQPAPAEPVAPPAPAEVQAEQMKIAKASPKPIRDPFIELSKQLVSDYTMHLSISSASLAGAAMAKELKRWNKSITFNLRQNRQKCNYIDFKWPSGLSVLKGDLHNPKKRRWVRDIPLLRCQSPTQAKQIRERIREWVTVTMLVGRLDRRYVVRGDTIYLRLRVPARGRGRVTPRNVVQISGMEKLPPGVTKA